MNKSNKDETVFISIARGMAIILVVLAHTPVPYMRQNSVFAAGLYDFVYSFHMALYAMLSGYLFELGLPRYKERGGVSFIMNKARVLLLPYLCFSLISYFGIYIALQIPVLARILSAGGYEVGGLSDSVIQILTYENHLDKHLWFVYALFIVFCVSYMFNAVSNKRLLFFVSAGIFIVIHNLDLPVVLDRSAYLLVFFTLARDTALINMLSRKREMKICGILFLLMYILSLSGVTSNAFLADAANLLTAITGALFCLGLARLLSVSRAAALLLSFNKYSYDIYLMHQPFITSGIGGILLAATDFPFVIICIVTFLSGMSIPILISWVAIRRVRLLRLLFLGSKN